MKWKNIFIPRKLWQAVQIESKTVLDLLRFGVPSHLLQYFGGIGDDLLCTAVAHEIKKQYQDSHLWILSRNQDLFLHNPTFAQVLSPAEHWHLWYSPMLKSRRLQLAYTQEKKPGSNLRHDMAPKEHIIASICRQAGLSGEITLKPYFYLTEKEKVFGRLAKKQLVIQCISPHSSSAMLNKLWHIERYQAVVDWLLATTALQVIQIGSLSDPLLVGAVDCRGKSIRQSAAILSQSECFVGTVGFLMHLARAVDCRAVIMYGGREHSWQSGYSCNENLNTYVDCAPCWKWNDCDYERKCMQTITVEMVVEAVERILADTRAVAADTITLCGSCVNHK